MLKRVSLVAVLVVFTANFSGCIFLAAGAAGAGTAKWLSEKVTQEVNSPLPKTVKAAQAALADMGVRVYKQTNAPDVVQILAKDSGGRQVWVDVRPVGNTTTRIDVRVGYVNGEADAQKILDRIVRKINSWL